MRHTITRTRRRIGALLGTLVAAVSAAGLLLTGGCAISTPFAGPGYDSSAGVTLDGAGDTVFVVVTRAVTGEDDGGEFGRQTDEVRRTMSSHAGLIGSSFRKQLFGSEAWTLSVWIDDEALQRFVRSSVHRTAVDRTPLSRADFAYAWVPVEDLPIGWGRALSILQEQMDNDGEADPALSVPARVHTRPDR